MGFESGVVRTDRRKCGRLSAFCAVELNSHTKQNRFGVTRDASDMGLLVVTPSRFEPGDHVDLGLFLHGYEARARGRVVRVHVNTPATNEIWRYRMGVALDAPLPAELLRRAIEAARESLPAMKVG